MTNIVYLCLSLTSYFFFFFFNDTATTEIYTLSLHDALPISPRRIGRVARAAPTRGRAHQGAADPHAHRARRSEEHTSELQSQSNLVCRLLLEKKKNKTRRSRNRDEPNMCTTIQQLHSSRRHY